MLDPILLFLVISAILPYIALSPVALLIFGAVKRKKRLVIVCCVIIALELLFVAYKIVFPTSYPYVDRWIIGKTEDEIIAVYGEPDVTHGYRIGYESYKSLLSSGPEYYYIHFDKNGIANLVEKSGPIGG